MRRHGAHRQGHRYAGTTHLLGALLAEPDGPASRLLRQLGVDPDAVRSDVQRSLERLAAGTTREI